MAVRGFRSSKPKSFWTREESISPTLGLFLVWRASVDCKNVVFANTQVHCRCARCESSDRNGSNVRSRRSPAQRPLRCHSVLERSSHHRMASLDSLSPRPNGCGTSDYFCNPRFFRWCNNVGKQFYGFLSKGRGALERLHDSALDNVFGISHRNFSRPCGR